MIYTYTSTYICNINLLLETLKKFIIFENLTEFKRMKRIVSILLINLRNFNYHLI